MNPAPMIPTLEHALRVALFLALALLGLGGVLGVLVWEKGRQWWTTLRRRFALLASPPTTSPTQPPPKPRKKRPLTVKLTRFVLALGRARTRRQVHLPLELDMTLSNLLDELDTRPTKKKKR